MENTKYIVLDKITKNEISEASENQNVIQQQKQKKLPQTPTSVVRRSTRLIRPLERYSPSIYYLLLTDSGELEKYE
jgi:hypothetical protein